MDWTDLQITVPVDALETASAIVQLVGSGLYIEDYSDLEEQTMAIAHIDLIDQELLEKNREQAIIHLYIAPGVSMAEEIAFIGYRLEQNGILFSMSTTEVHELDWATAWKSYY